MAIDFPAAGRWYHRFPGGWISRLRQWYRLRHPVAEPRWYGEPL